MLVVSHDRFFLDRVATHILAFEGDSHVEVFNGNWVRRCVLDGAGVDRTHVDFHIGRVRGEPSRARPRRRGLELQVSEARGGLSKLLKLIGFLGAESKLYDAMAARLLVSYRLLAFAQAQQLFGVSRRVT